MRRPSRHISARRTRESLRAGRSAHLIAPLNVLLTIVFEEEPEREFDAQRHVSSFLGKYRSWIAYRRRIGRCAVPPVWHLVMERQSRLHAHISLHVPPALMDEFRSACRLWKAKALPTTTMNETAIFNTNGLMRYLHKGIDPAQAYRFDIRSSDQGLVWGPRVRASRSLGPAAREKRSVVQIT